MYHYRTELRMVGLASTIRGQKLYWGGLPPPEDRKVLRATLSAMAVAVGLMGAAATFFAGLPVIGGAAATPFVATSHVIDRVKHNVEATDKMKYLAKYYSAQIFRVLGVRAREGQYATVDQFRQAAEINSELSKLYQAPLKKESKENRSSLRINGGIVAAGVVTGAGGALAGVADATKHAIEGIKIFGEAGKVASVAKGTLQTAALMARDGGAAMAGGALAHVLSHDTLDSQQFIEAIHKMRNDALANGIKPETVITPNRVFALRVSQDQKLSDLIKNSKELGDGKNFHQLSEAKQLEVMQAYPALANAATSEAYAVANGIIQPQQLAFAPNLDGMAARYALGNRNSSFAARIQTQRAAPTANIYSV